MLVLNVYIKVGEMGKVSARGEGKKKEPVSQRGPQIPTHSALITLSHVFPATAVISSLNIPFLWAAAERVWERYAKLSWSSLLTPHAAASLSAEEPITSPVENSAMAGSAGAKWEN